MAVVVFNTLSRRKEELVTRQPGKVFMYVCGPTVYNHIHVGNARAFIVFDTIRRYLRWRGFEVRFVQNYTDVDDKIIAKANEEGRSAAEVAEGYSRAFEEVMGALGIEGPDVLVRATDHISEMVEMIASLIERGFAYEAGGSVWFAVEKFDGYGKLSGRSLEDMRAGERVEPDPNKNHPLDFALWKAAKPGEPAWASPWGQGRPGWHIECSAMSLKYLGMSFDIHGGGADLVFPHHENEIAQSEAATGESPFVRYWLHNGLVHVDAEKMSKSLGNFVLLKDLLEETRPEAVRLMALSGHYRSDIDFGAAQLRDVKRAFERLEIFATATESHRAVATDQSKSFVERFTAAMDDDFNTPEALSVVHDLTRHANAELELTQRGDEEAEKRLGALAAAFEELTGVLGIYPDVAGGKTPQAGITGPLVEIALEARDAARSGGRYEEADRIRSRLQDLGIAIEDTPSGTRWRHSS